jgi:hypothetical protein
MRTQTLSRRESERLVQVVLLAQALYLSTSSNAARIKSASEPKSVGVS